MNKKTITFQTALFLSLLPFLLFAQAAENKEMAPTQAKLSIGFHVGLHFSDVTANMISFPFTEVNLSQLDRKTTVNGRIGIQALIHLSETYALETGVIYEKVGIKAKGFYDPFTESHVRNSNSTTNFAFEYFTVPLLFKKVFPLEGKIHLSMHIGPYFSFLQASSYGYETIDFQLNPDGTLSEITRDFAFSLDDSTRDTDVGIRLQFGAERKVSELATVYANGFYSRGLTRIDDFAGPGGSDGVHQFLGFAIGGYFRML